MAKWIEDVRNNIINVPLLIPIVVRSSYPQLLRIGSFKIVTITILGLNDKTDNLVMYKYFKFITSYCDLVCRYTHQL